MDVKLLDENSNKSLAILFDVKPELYLSEVRQVVSDQVSDVMPSSEYRFKYQGTELSKAQETVTTLQKIALSGDDLSFFMLPLSIPISNTADHTISTESGLESDSSDQTKPIKSTPPQTESPETKTKMLNLRSPSHAEIRNLRIFTDTEIENGRGKESDYRRFWNEKIRELANDRKISKKEIYKRVNENWKINRGKRLQNEAQEVHVTQTPEYEAASASHGHKMKKTTLPKNIIRVREASEAVESLSTEVSSLSESLKRQHDSSSEKSMMRNELKRAKTRLDSSRSELRKAQDTLRKNLSVKKSELPKHLDDVQ